MPSLHMSDSLLATFVVDFAFVADGFVLGFFCFVLLNFSFFADDLRYACLLFGFWASLKDF